MKFERYDQEALIKVVDDTTNAEVLSSQSVEACLLYEILVTLQEIRNSCHIMEPFPK